MILRHLEFLTALARERHFARAATACKVTQSTLSAGIKQMEEGLGVLLVERGQRFLGLTPEGEKVLEWAQHVITDYEGLQQSLTAMRRGLIGNLKIGAIPVTLPIVSLLLLLSTNVILIPRSSSVPSRQSKFREASTTLVSISG
jgi:DNA-binding transcriptional LysR family regulator